MSTNETIAVVGKILGGGVFFFLLMRGLVAIASDFTEWTLRRQGDSAESRSMKNADGPLTGLD